MSEQHEGTDQTTTEGAASAAPLPSLPVRLLQTIVSPGKAMSAIAEHPRWLGALLVATVVLALSVLLIPVEIMMEAQRRAIIASGRTAPEMPANAQTIIRIASVVGAGVFFVLMAFVGAAVTTFIFAFVLGDEGKYKQYLAVGVHAAIIPMLGALVLVPMKVAAEDPQLTINLATFLVFLPDGYVLNVFRAMDVTQIWAALVTAQGIHAIDRRRSVGSAAAIQIGILVVIALFVGWIFTRQGL